MIGPMISLKVAKDIPVIRDIRTKAVILHRAATTAARAPGGTLTRVTVITAIGGQKDRLHTKEAILRTRAAAMGGTHSMILITIHSLTAAMAKNSPGIRTAAR